MTALGLAIAVLCVPVAYALGRRDERKMMQQARRDDAAIKQHAAFRQELRHG